jgi:hypothetical protein
MTPPFDNLFNKVKQNTSKATQQLNLAAKIAKLRVEVTTQRAERERHLKSIGEKTYAIFMRDNTLEGKVVQEEVANELNLIDRIDKHIEELQKDISHLQSEFRSDKDVVDAAEVTETDDQDASDKGEDS